jgi:hypothetical protein
MDVVRTTPNIPLTYFYIGAGTLFFAQLTTPQYQENVFLNCFSEVSMSSVGSELYSGAAGFGRIWAVISACFATLVGIILLAVGILMLVVKPTPPKRGDPPQKGNPKVAGGILIFVAIMIVTLSWLMVYLTRHSKFAAAAMGVGGGIDLIRHI